MHDPIDDIKKKRFFLDVYENEDYLETDNEAEAYARFYACQFSCVLFDRGRLVADKEWVEDEVAESVIMSAELVGSEDQYHDLEEVAA
jgi:hypothetical protein